MITLFSNIKCFRVADKIWTMFTMDSTFIIEFYLLGSIRLVS
jgi:hypothetical protein